MVDNEIKITMKLLERIQTRYSVRSFLPTQVEKEKIDYLLECARWAPSAVNAQPWHIIVVQQEKNKRALHQCYQREWFKQAPMYMLVCSNHQESWKRKYDNNDHCSIDIAIAVEHIALAVQEVGLGTCWVCNFDAVLCAELFELPNHIEPIVILPIGYPNDSLNEKKRKLIQDIVEWK